MGVLGESFCAVVHRGGRFDQQSEKPSRRRVYIITIVNLGKSGVDMAEMVEEVAPRKSPRKGRRD